VRAADSKISHIEFEVFRLTEGRLELLIISVYLYFLIVRTPVCFPDTVCCPKKRYIAMLIGLALSCVESVSVLKKGTKV
jgi:hypothetical protein